MFLASSLAKNLVVVWLTKILKGHTSSDTLLLTKTTLWCVYHTCCCFLSDKGLAWAMYLLFVHSIMVATLIQELEGKSVCQESKLVYYHARNETDKSAL